ncbi:branched-chain amino acid ABC transporter permease [Candidatus Nitrotoga sp. M5]|uniref:branched-chain amino acid ABC transporter permease n=1 Tax=Candidatus Nitrotoga sp. M5 TaxID=2890409 RepID=UPI001EF4EF54|nr:branched-chain amino acid ABC transporter permease [Candidatus Nitrotoga sp. M5]CAH1387480.1 Branched-chain amino acid ABC transporter permease [Candidatus Nitrotoga sp. M5]
MAADIAQNIANALMAGSIYGLLAVSLALVFGVLEVPQFAFGAHAMLGAYSVAILASYGYWIPVAAAIVLMAILGVLVQALIFDPLRNAPPATLFIAAFGLLLVLQGMALVLFGPNNHSVAPAIAGGTTILGASITYQRMLVVAAAIIAVLGLNVFLRYTKTGRNIRAVGQSRTGSLVVGLSPRRVGLITMAIGSALAGLAGALLAPIAQVYPTMADTLVIKAFIIIVLAGMGSINGALLGGFIVGLCESFGSAYLSLEFKDAYPVALFILILLVRPQGLYGKVVRVA